MTSGDVKGESKDDIDGIGGKSDASRQMSAGDSGAEAGRSGRQGADDLDTSINQDDDVSDDPFSRAKDEDELNRMKMQ